MEHIVIVPSRSHLQLVPDHGSNGHEELTVEALYRLYSLEIASVGLRIFGRRADADDLVQEVFLQAYRSADKLVELAPSRRWLHVVAVRLAYRQLRRRRSSEPCLIDVDELAASGISPDDRTQLSTLYAALDRLPVKQRLAWSLRKIEGHTVREVAALCEIGPSTAKRRISAAEKALHAEFGGCDE